MSTNNYHHTSLPKVESRDYPRPKTTQNPSFSLWSHYRGGHRPTRPRYISRRNGTSRGTCLQTFTNTLANVSIWSTWLASAATDISGPAGQVAPLIVWPYWTIIRLLGGFRTWVVKYLHLRCNSVMVNDCMYGLNDASAVTHISGPVAVCIVSDNIEKDGQSLCVA